MDDLLVAVDIGSTSIKVIGFRPDGRMVETVRALTGTLRVATVTAGRQRFDGLLDIRQLWTVVQQNLAHLATMVRSRYRIRGIAVTGMGGPLVLIDPRGDPVYPLLSGWPIPSLSSRMEQLDETEFYLTTGYHRHNSIIATVSWLYENDSATFARGTKLLPVESYITYCLTGTMVADPSTAGATGAWDHAGRQWSWPLISRLNLTSDLFPPIAESGTVVGAVRTGVAEALGLPPDVPVAVGGHDYLCASLALDITQEGQFLDMLGTYEIISAPQTIKTLTNHDFFDLIVDSHVYPGMLSYMFQMVAGGQLEWIRHLLVRNDDEQWQDLNRLALGLDERDMKNLVFAPFLFGRLFPERCIYSEGAFLGLSHTHQAPHVIRAVVDALNYLSLEALMTLASFVGVQPPRVVVTGGGIRNPLWLQRKADFFQIPLSVPEVADATALGAALLAGVGAGVYRGVDEGIRAFSYRSFTVEPKDNPSVDYLSRFFRWDDHHPDACQDTMAVSLQIGRQLLNTMNRRHST